VAQGRSRPGARSSEHRRDEAAGRRVLVVDDAEAVRTFLAHLLELRGYAVDTADDGRSALALLEGGAAPDVVLLDVMMPGQDGLATLARIREEHPGVSVVMLSVVGKTATIVEAMRLGAADYLNKPFEEAELETALARVFERRALEQERVARGQQHASAGETIAWASAAMQRVKALLEQVADTDVTVLIQGESGSGKEIVARTLHAVSTRAKARFVKVNCAALPEDLLESELFGYEKGAFTGAAARKQGKFELAHGGSIFLDEIGEMSPALQAKLLQVLQDGRFTRLGGNQEIAVDVRVACATNRKLDGMVREGTFREDLFFRLNVVTVTLPPLRDRREEIPTLVANFLRSFAARYHKPLPRLSDRLMRALDRYAFPGNVRELENMMKRIIVLESEAQILDEVLRADRSGRPAGSSLLRLIAEIEATAGEIPLREVGRRAAQVAERETIDRVLHHTNWNRKQAARLLGVSYKTLLQKIRDCGLEPL
jgi:two-component system, NtrC family, response regulator AtoC